MNNSAMLNAYPDSLGGTLKDIADLLERQEMKDVFRSFYILPSLFHTDLDRGFSVISYDLNKILACSEDLERLHAQGVGLKLDFILNHLSVLSAQFQDILKNGKASAYRDFFIDWNKFWEGKGEMKKEGYIQPDEDLIRDMFFRKPGLPILMVRLPDGSDVPYWNTFYQEVGYDLPQVQHLMEALDLQYDEAAALECLIRDQLEKALKPMKMDLGRFESRHSEVTELLESHRSYLGQMDLNLHSPLVWEFYNETLRRLAQYGASIVRLDAFAYASKTPGMRNFLNEPDTWDVLERVAQIALKYGVTLLPEIHASYGEGSYLQLAEKGYIIYDFFLPGLLIDAIENGSVMTLADWARELRDRNIRTINMLGCHDGIPMLDLKGLIPEKRIEALIELIVGRGGLIKNLHGQKNVYYQINATYFSALGADERKMLLARVLQLFMPGKPQVWYLDLFAGENDLSAVQKEGEAGHKEINRTNLNCEEIEQGLKRPLVLKQLELLRMHNLCPAFEEGAELTIEMPSSSIIIMTWKKDGYKSFLSADLVTHSFSVEADLPDGPWSFEQ